VPALKFPISFIFPNDMTCRVELPRHLLLVAESQSNDARSRIPHGELEYTTRMRRYLSSPGRFSALYTTFTDARLVKK
jgi:hypothetical protein